MTIGVAPPRLTESIERPGAAIAVLHRGWRRSRLTALVARLARALVARWPLALTLASATAWAGLFGWLAVSRHLAGGSHAEDLGFTEQVLANFLRGQFFRMSIYQGASWNTELDISRLARPDSLLAFHVEPMLLGLVPVYASGGINLLLVVQATAVAAGAVPAYRLARHATGSALAGLVVGLAYLLSPLGQWAVLADVHTSTLAAPLLLLAIERLLVACANRQGTHGVLRHATGTRQGLLAAALALSAREDVGPVVAALGVSIVLWNAHARRSGLALAALGIAWTALALGILRHYSGDVSPFAVRYGSTFGAGATSLLAALERPLVLQYLLGLVLGGGWLGLLAPLALLPALPSLALNTLSSSPWMASGQAHYSGLVLPFLIAAAALGLGRLRHHPRWLQIATAALALTSIAGYLQWGSGPLGGNWIPARVDQHAQLADSIARSLPSDAAASASTSLVPRLASRPRLYVFPAILDADYVFVDLRATPAPTSAGDVYLRINDLLASGDWSIASATDGLLLLQRAPGTSETSISMVRAAMRTHRPAEPTAETTGSADTAAPATYADGHVALLDARLLPSPDAAIDVAGPHWILRTTWRTDQPLPAGTQLDFWLDLGDAQPHHIWDVADDWWNPPATWPTGQAITIDVPDMPIRQFRSWQATFSPSGPS